MNLSSLCKVTSIIVIILNTISSLTLASFLSDNFSFLIFISVLVPGLILGLVLYALGEVLKWLYEISYRVGSISYSVCSDSDDGLSRLMKEKSVSHAPKKSGWTCPKCGAHNLASAVYCKDCGTYK